MVDKDELGLSLSLSCSKATTNCNIHKPPPQLNLMLIPFPSPPGFGTLNADLNSGEASGIDVNNVPTECDEEAGVPSHDRASSRGISDDEDGDASRKKLRLSKDQSAILEETFKQHSTLNPKQKMALARQLGLRPRQIEVWFQNRRARTKLKQNEVDYEFLKRCCDKLTQENRRLQKEVRELRALRLSPQFSMHMTPPTTLTMCPSCERVSVLSDADPRPGPVPDRHLSGIMVMLGRGKRPALMDYKLSCSLMPVSVRAGKPI